MATVIIVSKLMPESPDTDLEEIKIEAEKLLKAQSAKSIKFEEKPIAFGLKAIFVTIEIPEDKGSEIVESELAKIPHVSSVTIEDYRRAFG